MRESTILIKKICCRPSQSSLVIVGSSISSSIGMKITRLTSTITPAICNSSCIKKRRPGERSQGSTGSSKRDTSRLHSVITQPIAMYQTRSASACLTVRASYIIPQSSKGLIINMERISVTVISGTTIILNLLRCFVDPIRSLSMLQSYHYLHSRLKSLTQPEQSIPEVTHSPAEAFTLQQTQNSLR